MNKAGALIALVFALSGCLHEAMARQIGFAENCEADKVKIIDQQGTVAHVDVCGTVKTCRFDKNKESWVCEQTPSTP